MAEIKKASTKAVKDSNGLDKKTLFVRQIPLEATSEELSDFFSQFAPIRHAVVVTNDEGSRGFGFVNFASDEDSSAALASSRKVTFKGQRLRVDVAKRRERQEKKSGGPSGANLSGPVSEEKKRCRLIIRNLPWSVRDPEVLKKHFQRYGTVVDSTIPRKPGGKMSGFGFVQMKKPSAAEAALEKSKTFKLDGREVTVDFAVQKSQWVTKEVKNEEKAEDEAEEEDEEDSDEDEEAEDEDEENEEEENSSEAKEVEGEEKTGQSEVKIPIKRPNKEQPFTVFLRNLPYDATKETLKEHFERFGPVKYALPVIDADSGLAKGTGFVAFTNEKLYNECLANAPDIASKSGSVLLPDDVPVDYVYEGRILSITPAVNRERAGELKDKNFEDRAKVLGREQGKQDRRNVFLLNEGRVTSTSKAAESLSKTELEIREKSYQQRIEQLNKNPSLHLSLTRLAVRNLPRTMGEKSFKALGRKAVVEFAKEVKHEMRQPLSKEEAIRSTKNKKDNSLEDPNSKKSKKKGVVRQAKVLVEVNSGGNTGRSKGYGFLEFRDHKSALMALRYLNCHEVTREEILEGLTEDEQKYIKFDDKNKRRLVVEFAIENAEVVKRRRDKIKTARDLAEVKKQPESEQGSGKAVKKSEKKFDHKRKRAESEFKVSKRSKPY